MTDTQETLRDRLLERHQQFCSRFQAEFADWRPAPLPVEAAGQAPREIHQRLTDYWLSRKNGVLSQRMKELGKAAPEDRPKLGGRLNAFKAEFEQALAEMETEIRAFETAAAAARDRVDISLPGTGSRLGRLHPLTQIRQKIEDIFTAMGYAVEDGPEVDTTFYNFDALNIPAGHPARESQDTFYVTPDLAMRSQTSNVQIHAMRRRRPPLRVIAPGRVFRRDTPDATHNPMFFQVEGLNVGPGITMGDLKGTLQVFLEKLFERSITVRFRPSYFPFVEPGAETDFQCIFCEGSGCRVCKQSGWIELGGSGMVHPNVLRACNIDPNEHSGFAFGFGIDRMAAMLYGIDDIRNYFINDVRFLEQF